MSSTEPTILEKAKSLATSMLQSDSVAKETSATLTHQNQTKTHTRYAARNTKKNARKTAQKTKIAAKSISGSAESAEQKIARNFKRKARCIFNDAKVAAAHKIKQMRDTSKVGKKRRQDGAQESAGLAQSATEVNKANAATARTEALIGDAKKAWKESYHYLKDTLKWAATQSKSGAAGSAQGTDGNPADRGQKTSQFIIEKLKKVTSEINCHFQAAGLRWNRRNTRTQNSPKNATKTVDPKG